MSAYEPELINDLGIGRLFDVLSDAVVIGDPATGQITHWNRAAVDLFGYSIQEAVGSPIEGLAAPEVREAHRSGLARYASDGTGPIVDSGDAVEVPAVTKDGRRLWVELRIDAIDSRAGRRYVVAVVRDVSDRWALQQQLEEAAEVEQERSASLRRFASMAAHDLRGPLTTAEALLALAHEGGGLPTQAAELLQRARRLAVTARDRADDLLEHLLLEAGADVAEPTPVSLRAALHDVDTTHGTQVDVEPHLVALVDGRHLARILDNLLTNARNYGEPPICVVARSDGDAVLVTVSDAGAGIAGGRADELFEPFVRGPNNRGVAGTGLGLAAARTLARLNAGELRYKPEGSGTTFELRLPRASSADG